MESVIFLVLAFVLWLAVWSIVSVFKIMRQREDLERLRYEQNEVATQLQEELKSLRAEVKALAAKPSTVPPPAPLSPSPPPPVSDQAVVHESAQFSPPIVPLVAVSPAPRSVVQPAASHAAAFPHLTTSVAPPPLPVSPADVFPSAPSTAVPASTPPPLPPVQPSPASPPLLNASEPDPEAAPSSFINWELFMGVRLFAWIGGLAAFFGIALFVKLSIENNWIPPEVRVAAAFLAGLGLLVGGLVLARRGLEVQAHTLCASGVVSLYAVTFACNSHYHFPFFDQEATFALMVLITATAFLLAARLKAQVVALLGLLGGFLTPVLLSTGVDNPTGLFGYLAFLDAGLIAVALYCRWHYMVSLAAFATVLMQAAWSERFFSSEKMSVAFVVLLGFNLLFMAAVELARRFRESGPWLVYPAAGLASFSLFFCFHLLGYHSLMQEPLLPLCLLLAADLCLLALSVRNAGFSLLHLPAGIACFGWLALWLSGRHADDSLNLQLGVVFLFSLLHVVFPLVMAHLKPGFGGRRWAQYFPVAALLLVLIPLIQIPEPPFILWPVILLLDVLAIGAAWLLCSVVGVLMVLLLSLFAVAVVILGKPLALIEGSADSFILLAGFFGLFFCGAAYVLIRRFTAQSSTGHSSGETSEADADLLPHLPVLSAFLPFILLMMVVLRLPLSSPDSVFGLALVLSVLLCGLSVLLHNGRLILVALGAVAALEWCWQGRGLSHENALSTVLWFLGFYALFLLQAFVLRKRLPKLVSPWLAASLAGPLQALLVHHLVGRFWPNDVMGIIPLFFAFPSLAALIACLRSFDLKDERRLSVFALFGGVALLFITVAIPVQFDRQWITLGWALEGAALLWLFHRIPHEGLRITGVLLLGISFARLTLNPAIFDYQLRGEWPLLNWYLYAYGIGIVSLLAGARFLAPPRDRIFGLCAPSWFVGMAVVLAFYLLNIEIADTFTAAGSVLHFRFSGNFARDISYTIGWSLFALGLLMLGFRHREKLARRAGLALFAIALLKLFTHDISSLGQIYKVIAFIVVAGIAFAASFLYQRFQRAEQPPSS